MVGKIFCFVFKIEILLKIIKRLYKLSFVTCHVYYTFQM